MILIADRVYKILEQYRSYLIQEELTSKDRAKEKVDLILQALYKNLGGIITHRLSPYKELGNDEKCLLYVYKDSKSKSQWGFAYKRFDNDNMIVYYMRNFKLVREVKI